MSNAVQRKGRCLCGAVSITASRASQRLGACHCSMCRKWGGGPFLAVDCGSEVEFEGQKNIAAFNSSAWAERGFCKHCGTHLFYHLKAKNQYMLPVGLFDDAGDVVFDHQIFIDEKPAYYCFADETKNLTGAQVFARFSS